MVFISIQCQDAIFASLPGKKIEWRGSTRNLRTIAKNLLTQRWSSLCVFVYDWQSLLAPIDRAEICWPKMSAKSPSNISPNPLQVICKVSDPTSNLWNPFETFVLNTPVNQTQFRTLNERINYVILGDCNWYNCWTCRTCLCRCQICKQNWESWYGLLHRYTAWGKGSSTFLWNKYWLN